MASVKIFERDYTESAPYEPTETVVYIPGMAGEDCVDVGALLGKPILFSSEAKFQAVVGSKPKDLSVKDSEGRPLVPIFDKSFVMAKQLLALGMQVLYEVVAVKDGESTRAAATIDEVRNAIKESSHWAKLYDRALYNPRFLTSGGYGTVTSYVDEEKGKVIDGTIAQCMLNCAHFQAGDEGEENIGRGDCVALIDHESSLKDMDEINDIFNNASSPFKNFGELGTFGAAFTPWCSHSISADLGGIVSPDDSAAGTWLLPPSFAYLVAYQSAIATNPTWYAAAGVTRGAISTLVKPVVDFGEVASTAFQSRVDGFIAVNPICYITPYGYRIYGNRTLRMNGLNSKSNLVATSFLNIRNLVSDIKKTSFAACRRMAFEQNTDILWFNLKSQISPLLEKMQSGNGIAGYKVIRVPSGEKATVKGKIRIIPIEAVEDFELTIELTDSLEIETEE